LKFEVSINAVPRNIEQNPIMPVIARSVEVDEGDVAISG
jgi:hypothetical protein